MQCWPWRRKAHVRRHVGKRAGGPSCSQRFIHRRMLTLSRRGDRVVRLKGGDPLVFGRGSEEALELAAAGVRCHFVPGITAGIGGLAAAGIPLTQRDVNQGAIFLTGSDGRGELPNHDWQALAAANMPLVVYMGFRRRRDIAAQLLAAGLRSDLPNAVVFDATGPGQSVREQPLSELARDMAPGPQGAPALLVIGATVGLRAAMLDAMQAADQADLDDAFAIDLETGGTPSAASA